MRSLGERSVFGFVCCREREEIEDETRAREEKRFGRSQVLEARR